MKSRWQSFINRIKQEEVLQGKLKNNREGLVIVTSHVLINGDGEPLAWVVESGKRIEPSKDAAEIVKMIIDAS